MTIAAGSVNRRPLFNRSSSNLSRMPMHYRLTQTPSH